MTKFDDLISRTNSICVLKIVGENPGIGQREVIEFVEAGLIVEKTISAGRTVKQYYLSEKGERFLKMYLDFENGEDRDGPPSIDGVPDLGEKT